MYQYRLIETWFQEDHPVDTSRPKNRPAVLLDKRNSSTAAVLFAPCALLIGLTLLFFTHQREQVGASVEPPPTELLAAFGERANSVAASDVLACGTFSNGLAPEKVAYATNAKISKCLDWLPPTKSLQASIEEAFPGGKGWQDVTFNEAPGVSWTQAAVLDWVEVNLLNGPDPFASHGGQVPVPGTALPAHNAQFPTPKDQLEAGQWVSYSRRQVCFIVAKSMIGAGTAGYQNGLLRFLQKTTGGGCVASAGDFGRAWWGQLVACAADPALANGGQGPILLVAKALDRPEISEVRQASQTPIGSALLRVCPYGFGDDVTLPGIQAVPPEGCVQPAEDNPGIDFMTGGLPSQAIQDISAKFLGGYIYGNACGLGGGQDERLMVYYPEVAALVFFLSEAGPDGVYGPPQLREPAWILGARRLRSGLDGTCLHEDHFDLDPTLPFERDLKMVTLGSREAKISSSRPFLAFMSESQGFLGWPETEIAVRAARRNKEPRQRDVDGEFSFEKQVRAWYRAVSLKSYDVEVQDTLLKLVQSVGVGPWLAGLWWGDSQLGLLASWLGHAAAAQSWGGSFVLDYYLYAAFTENPGNQCLVLPEESCHICLARCAALVPQRPEAFYLPTGSAFMNESAPGQTYACPSPRDCGQKGLQDVVAAYGGRPAIDLWTDLEESLRKQPGDVSMTVFDLLLGVPAGAVP